MTQSNAVRLSSYHTLTHNIQDKRCQLGYLGKKDGCSIDSHEIKDFTLNTTDS